MIRAFIVDDEKQLRITLRKDIELFCKNIEISGEAASCQEALEEIEKLKPELLFLDIRLGDGTGFSILEKAAHKNFVTIFITAYEEYAIKAIKSEAADYLLKPYSKEELQQAVQKAEQRLAASKLMQSSLATSSKISISTTEGLKLLEQQEIIYCKSHGNYTMIYLQDKKRILSGKTLKTYEELLEDKGFIRCHHSFLVNLQHIKQYDNRGGGMLILSNNEQIPIAQRRKSAVLRLIGPQ